MVEPIFHCSSSRVGNPHQENAVIDLFCTLSARETALRGARHRRMGGLESSDAQQQSSRLGGYGFGTLHAPDNPTSGKETWIRRCVSEKHGQGQQQESLEAIEQGGSPSNVSELENNPPKTMQRAHSERLRMVGAVDKTEMRGGVVDQGKSPLALAQEAAEKGARSHWDFANLPTSSTGSKRSMTVSEVLLIQSIGQAVICTDLQGNITRWNQAAESIYLWKAEEVLGQNLAQLLSPKHLGKDLIEVIGKASHGESWSGPYPALRKDEVIISTVVTDTPIVDSNNKIIGIISVSFDVSSLPGVETTIRRSQSAEAISNEKEKEIITPTGSDDGKNMLSWRRVHLEAENQGEDSLADVNSNAESSSNYLSAGRFSVQQLLRKLTIGTGQRQGDYTQFNSEVRESPTEEFGTDQGRRMPSQPIAGRTIEHSQTFPVYVPNDGMEGDSGEGDGSSLPLVVPSKRHTGGSGSSESSGAQEVVKEIMANSLVIPQLGVTTQSLSRSSSGSAPGSAMAPDASSVGSPVERLALDNMWTPGSGTALNFQQAEEDFQLQLALALRVAAEAAAVDDPDIANVRGPKGNAKQTTGISKMEATAYRYWVSSCLGYDDRIEDGFYVVWGMSPYVWSMCTDSTELGRMPPLENLRAVSINDATFEVVLVDRNMDPTLSELEDKAVGLAYESTDVLDMASELAKMVAKVMGGPLKSDEVLEKEWQIASNKLMQVLGTIVVPIGVLRVGLSRHRALLFKVLADSVGLACRLVRGGAFCGKDSDSSVVVKCNDDKEWMIDLLQNPGTRMSPDKRVAPKPTVIPSPLQFERMNPFSGSGVSVLHWTRGEPKSRDGLSAGDSLQRRIFSEPMRNVGSPTRMNGGDVPIQQGLDFFQAEGSQGANNKAREYDDDKEKYGLVNLLDRRGSIGQLDSKFRSTDGSEGNFFLENASKESNVRDKFQRPPSGQELRVSESPRADADQNYERVWAREGRRNSGSDDSGKVSGPSRMLDQIASESSDFEIAWDDVVMGERIGQGSYGKVYRADWQGSDVAVKVFLDQDLKTEALEEFKSEVAIMRRLRHPNIVLFMGAVTKPPNLSIITEFCPRGSLYRLLHRPNRELDDRKRIRMAVDVAKGMNYLHRCSPPVVHRDLKSPNLLVDKNWTVKVCDFGLSRQKHSTFLSSKSSAGTPEWMAPEVLRNEPSDEKSDVYSFGVILWELATLQVPWNGMNPVQVVGAVGFQHRRLSIPDHIDRPIAAIIQACWRTDTKLRPSFADLMQELKLLQQRPRAAQSPSSPTLRQSSLRKENDDANMD